MKIKDMIFDGIKGFFVGVALLIPGVSAATIAFVTKIYDKLISNISTLLKSFWSSLKALLPIGVGVLVGMIGLWYPLHLAVEQILFAIVCLFAGSMIGSIPDITSNLKEEKIKPHQYLYLLIAILAGMSLGIMSYHLNADVHSLFEPIHWSLYLIMIPVGFIASAGIVVPGISGSMLLLVLGFYTNILGLIESIKSQPGQVIGVLACMAVGVIIGMFFFSKLMKQLFAKYKTATYIWIVGLVIGSIFSLFYNHDMMAYYQSERGIPWWEGLLGAILLIGGFVGSYFLVLYQRKQSHLLNKSE